MSFTNRAIRISASFLKNNSEVERTTIYKWPGLTLVRINVTPASDSDSLALLKHNLKYALSQIRKLVLHQTHAA